MSLGSSSKPAGGSWPCHHHRGPSWPRSGFAGGQPPTLTRHLPRDRLSPVVSSYGSQPESLHGGDKASGLAQERIHQLEKIISFLKSQHSDTLHQLHSEIEKLKLENKELNFKIVMCRCGQISSQSSRQSHRKVASQMYSTGTDGEMRPPYEVRELQNALQNERSRNNRLMKLIEQRVQHSFDHSDMESQVVDCHQYGETDHLPLSLDECRTMIQELKSVNQRQSHELFQLKADLEDLLFSDKWTPDAYLIARAYIPDTEVETNRHKEMDNSSTRTKQSKLPQLVRRNEEVKERAYRRLHESVHLPALKPRLSTLISERHRRTVSLQRNRTL